MAVDTANLKFRPATVEEAPALEAFINTAFCDDPTDEVFLSPDHDTIDVTTAADLAAKMAQPNTVLLVATDGDGGPLLAHCSLRMMEDGTTAWFGLFAVDVALKGQGLGTLVLRYAEEYALRELGARRIEFDVVNTREALIRFYVRRGYQPTGKTLPFPYDDKGEWRSTLRGDLEFVLFGKDLGEVSTTNV